MSWKTVSGRTGLRAEKIVSRALGLVISVGLFLGTFAAVSVPAQAMTGPESDLSQFTTVADTATLQTVKVTGGTAAQQAAVRDTLSSRPALLAYVLAAWPDFYVRIDYGGHAWPGHLDVLITAEGAEFTDIVAHEFCHEVHLASDASGKSIWGPWVALLRSKGYTSKSFVYGETRPLLGKRCPVEGLAENMAHRLYPAYMASTVPDTYLAKLTSAEIVTFLTANGVEPGQVERDLTATSVVLRRAGHQIAPNPQPFRA